MDVMVEKEIGNINEIVQSKLSSISKLKRKENASFKIEYDSILFDNSSVGTILKNAAEHQFFVYKDLSDKQQHVIGMSLNSIIDISDETKDSQKQYFTETQWRTIKSTYKTKKSSPSDEFEELLTNINKEIKEPDLKKAYILARRSELNNLNSDKEWIFAVYSHIINIYRKKTTILQPARNSTELDCLIKIWGEILETWGESQSSHNGYKIDCRIIYIHNDKEVDICDVEAARYMFTKKTNNDHLKLCIESKDIIDFIVKNSSNFDPEEVNIYMIQICANICEVKSLRLCDKGLYCVESLYDLTVPTSIDFGKISNEWFSSLLLLKENCLKISKYINEKKKKHIICTSTAQQTKKKIMKIGLDKLSTLPEMKILLSCQVFFMAQIKKSLKKQQRSK
ncbi:hypothetical protein BDF14DRAFT_1840574 [Spinellus fusiger]|nr:hypothetical protein BDF14DRAFT_1840574 [Spinellus fusiger]